MMFDKEEVKELAKKYDLSIKYFGDKVLVTTGIDEWVIRNDGNKVASYHKPNHSGGWNNYHLQRYFSKLEHAIDSISQHRNKSKYGFHQMFRMKRLLKNA